EYRDLHKRAEASPGERVLAATLEAGSRGEFLRASFLGAADCGPEESDVFVGGDRTDPHIGHGMCRAVRPASVERRRPRASSMHSAISGRCGRVSPIRAVTDAGGERK